MKNFLSGLMKEKGTHVVIGAVFGAGAGVVTAIVEQLTTGGFGNGSVETLVASVGVVVGGWVATYLRDQKAAQDAEAAGVSPVPPPTVKP